MEHVLIVTGGNRDVEQYKSLIHTAKNPFVIGVDGGALWLSENNFSMNLAVGDFDTIGNEGLRKLQGLGIEICTFQAEKDETDTELAVRLALERNPRRITIYGALGSRFDHSFANVHLLLKCVESGVLSEVVDPTNCIQMITHSITLERKYPYVSLLPFTPSVEGVTLTGFKYPLQDATLRWGDTIGISNEIVGDEGSINFHSGMLLVIESKD